MFAEGDAGTGARERAIDRVYYGRYEWGRLRNVANWLQRFRFVVALLHLRWFWLRNKR
jgi:hypothetical protein